jgi:multidrug efflux pump subunit AcrB
MRKAIIYFINNPIWVTVLMFSIVIFGLISFGNIRYSFFPETKPDTITIQVAYPGASPEEVAEGIILKIEENLDGLEGIERITSVSRENFGTVTVEATKSASLDKVLTDVKNAVDRISSFPVDAEKPVIFEQKFRSRSLSVVLYGETDLFNLKYIAEGFRDDLLATDEISQVDIEGLPNLEMSIEISETALRRYGLTFDEIASAVRRANVNLSGGKLETDAEELLIRTWGRDYYARELKDIVVRGQRGGTVVRLTDVADIHERWEDIPDKIYYNDQASIILNIDQAAREDILAIADKAKALVEKFNAEHTTVKALVLDDRTIPLQQRLNLLTKNGLMGLLLVIFALGFFLNSKLSFWVSVAIPFSFAGMFIVASFWGITINVMSLFGMILVVGILVDDGIVVGENIFSHYERGKPPLKAAVDGTTEVIAPVATSVMTTVIAFLPFFFLDGNLGKFIWQMALVVIASLLFSLVEAFFMLPSHLAHSNALKPKKGPSIIRQKIEKTIKFLTLNMYAKSLRTALNHKWITIVIPVALVMFTIGLVGGGIIGVTFFPFIDSDTLPVNLSLVPGRQEADTDSILARIETVGWEINDEIKAERPDGRDVILGVKREIGNNDFGESGSHAGRLTFELLDGEERDMESYLIANRIRDRVGLIPEVQNITYGSTGRFGKPVSISLLGNNYAELDKARNMLVAELENFSSLKDVTDSDREGRREININLKPQAYALGLTLNDVVGQVRQAFFGQEIQRIQRGRDEIRVWVRYTPGDRTALGNLDQMRIRMANGREYPFNELAAYDIRRGITQINRLDRMREIKVEANLANVEDDLPPILQEIEMNVLPQILGQTEGVRASFEGQSRDQAKIMRSMKIAFPVALIGMFIMVILVFRSYAQAIMIFSLIPIGILGAVWGHGIQGLQLNMLSLFGIIALSGVIINNSIVFVDRINRNLKEKQTIYEAVYNAGLSRLRPILLTSLTTSFGLAPLILETSRQAQFLIPLAVSIAYGLMFGTFILLIILPATFLAFNSVRVQFARLFKNRPVTPEEVEPAVQKFGWTMAE